MFIIGLDLSINNSSYTVLDLEKNEIYFGSIVNDVSISKKKIDRLNDLSYMINNFSICFTTGLEGFSYGSQGMAVFDVPMLTGIIRKDILETIAQFDANRIFVFPPSDLKKEFGCKGNSDKGVIFTEFIKDPKTEVIKNSEFYNFLVRNKNDKLISNVNSSEHLIIESPFNDIIDSYLSVYKILKNLEINV